MTRPGHMDKKHTQKYVLPRQTLLLAIDLHNMVDIGLEPFLGNVQVRNIAKDRRLGIYIRHLVARPQLERMDAADRLSDGPRTEYKCR
jgi:hypothetical protein